MTTLSENKTDKKYTLVIRGEVCLNWDDLEYLEEAITTVPSTRGTYIHYNESGKEAYNNDHL